MKINETQIWKVLNYKKYYIRKSGGSQGCRNYETKR